MPKLLATVCSASSLIHFAVVEKFVSHFYVNYEHLFTQDLNWHWFEDF